MKKISIFLFVVLMINRSYAQTEMSVFTATGRGVATTFVTDYQSIGINPANLGLKPKHENKHLTFGLLETGVSAYSGAFTKSQLLNTFKNINTKFNYADKLNASNKFADQPFSINADVNILGIAYQNEKLGGFAFGIRESVRYFSQFNKTSSQILFLGFGAPYFDQFKLQDGSQIPNTPENYDKYKDQIKQGILQNHPSQLVSQLFNGSKISFNWFREYNLSYGKEILKNDAVALNVGIGLKYIQGFGYIDIQSKDGKLFSAGAVSPVLNLSFGSAAANNPSADTSSKARPAGKGFGTDLGITLVIKEKLKIAIAANNIGSVTYDVNVYTVNDFQLTDLTSHGADQYNLYQGLKEFTADGKFFKYTGRDKIKVKLPTMYRIGVSQQLTDVAEVGLDIVVPANNVAGNLQKVYMAIGGDFHPKPWIRLSGGISRGGNFGNRVNIPIGFGIIAGDGGTWEFGLASRDAISYFINKGPALSVAFGFLRFRL